MEQAGELCKACQAIDLRLYLFQDSYPGSVRLGTFQEILRRDRCSLCKLIVQALSAGSKDYWVEGVYPSEDCYLGRSGGRSHCPILEVWFDSTSATLPKGTFGHSTTRGEILAVNGDINSTERGPAYMGRVVEPSVNFSLLRSWLTECNKNHGMKCRTAKKEESSKGQYLIDVKRRCLVKYEKGCRYLALSYVWGKARMFRTVESNLTQLQEDGTLEIFGHQITVVVTDAMEVVANLGEDYLWVDALCIVQDNESKPEQISQMDAIYRQAISTIFAIAGKDANTGLPGVHPKSRSLCQASNNIQGLVLTTKLADLSPTLDKSVWGSRAWTLQEEILSRRCLYFTEHQVYFQCQSGMRREDLLNEYSDSSAAYNPLERKIWATDNTYGPIFNIYESFVKMYTRRELSYPSDILNAFTGILSAMQKRFGWQFLSTFLHEGAPKTGQPPSTSNLKKYPVQQSLEYWPPHSNYQMAKYELVLLSRCHQKIITEEDIESNLHRLPLEFPSSQAYYDEIFDTYHYEPTVDWAANIMLIEWKGDDYAVRIAIGQAHVDAWENADVKKKLVRLA